jgi:nucleoside-diphosphate-sugar epimerase
VIEGAMKVLVTGHDGYIGSVLVPYLQRAGLEVHGLDSFLFEGCAFGGAAADVSALALDLRDVEPGHLTGYDAVVHLAALSNDPLGDLAPEITYEVNHLAAVRLARLARAADVARFVFSSSCSLYGAAGQTPVAEDAPSAPVTPYGRSKILVEQDVAALADERFSPVFLRNATAYGSSPRLRTDLMVNNLVGYALTTGEVLIKSDGTPWRPLVHIEDIAQAVLAVLRAPRERIHNEAFNVGADAENYRVREVAALVEELVPGSRVAYAADAGPDIRNYRVTFGKIARALPDFRPRWTVRAGIEELIAAYRQNGLEAEDFLSGRYSRIHHLRRLQAAGAVDATLRRRAAAALRTSA